MELGGVVRTVDDPTVIRGLSVGLGTKFKSEVLDEISRRPTERLGNRVQVDDNGLNTVTLALDLSLELLHLVAIEGISDIPANVDGGHGDG